MAVVASARDVVSTMCIVSSTTCTVTDVVKEATISIWDVTDAVRAAVSSVWAITNTM